MHKLSALIVCIFLCLTSCYSLLMERGTASIRSADSASNLEVSSCRVLGYDAINGLGAQPPSLAWTILIGIVTWPFDVVSSSFQGTISLFNPDVGIALGPLGAAGDILLPGLTLSPYLMASMPPHVLEIRIEPDEYSALMCAVRRGDLSACIELIELIERHAGRGVRDIVPMNSKAAPWPIATEGS